jgi:hypothetical protein
MTKLKGASGLEGQFFDASTKNTLIWCASDGREIGSTGRVIGMREDRVVPMCRCKTTNANRNKKAIRSVAKRGFGFAKRDGGSSFKGLALAA